MLTEIKSKIKRVFNGSAIGGNYLRYASIITLLLLLLFYDKIFYLVKKHIPMNVDMSNKNVRAFLMVIRHCEGTQDVNGYRTLFGGSLFNGFKDHPRIPKQFRSGTRLLWTSAAGAYQFLAVTAKTKIDTWDAVKKKLNLPDFSPASQDRAAVEKIAERGGYDYVLKGRLEKAIAACNKEWASLPGSPYGQPVKTISYCKQIFLKYGGTLA
jgi:muramidase (phage lysozyme)